MSFRCRKSLWSIRENKYKQKNCAFKIKTKKNNQNRMHLKIIHFMKSDKKQKSQFFKT